MMLRMVDVLHDLQRRWSSSLPGTKVSRGESFTSTSRVVHGRGKPNNTAMLCFCRVRASTRLIRLRDRVFKVDNR
jgi:hypothetical protein